MNTSRCPNCNSDVIIADDAYEGDLVDCMNCQAVLEITKLHPPQLNELADDENN